MEREKKLVSLCLLILFISLVVVYALLYQVRWGEIISQLPQQGEQNLTWVQTWNDKKEEKSQIFTLDFATGSQNSNSWVIHSNIPAPAQDAISGALESNQTASTENFLSFQESNVQMLSGAEMYFWVLESLELLGLTPEYLLRDKKDMYYAFFKKEPIHVKKTVQQLNGNIYTIASEAELLKNQLFGKKVMYINLPEYKDKLVLMLVEVRGNYRFLQIPYKDYHKSKSYLKSLFI